ncbi:predicted protein [Sclerotinia sclerotiorum 1980 UF-70]|uniref:Uncharacterized protein n=1 Tax=Sclerotinia sclerotiorum (strain ATCC 18683 / 1980 / Ss-1) TaxID=665079 RepID=A7EJ23_SCLS1|nr:predicted protein [Sclerotinia sclerotiorum 1980 UF-70]EDO02839.1 predicted protein [Sclerotinia sclerotiorum 1980 UF-70]
MVPADWMPGCGVASGIGFEIRSTHEVLKKVEARSAEHDHWIFMRKGESSDDENGNLYQPINWTKHMFHYLPKTVSEDNQNSSIEEKGEVKTRESGNSA